MKHIRAVFFSECTARDHAAQQRHRSRVGVGIEEHCRLDLQVERGHKHSGYVGMLDFYTKNSNVLYAVSYYFPVFQVSFANVSSADDYVRPTFSDKLQIVGSRHPILERLETVSDVVANDVLAAPGDSNFHVLFGPNMSGKSTYLKQIILLQIMAQVGCFVPAAKSNLIRSVKT